MGRSDHRTDRQLEESRAPSTTCLLRHGESSSPLLRQQRMSPLSYWHPFDQAVLYLSS